MTAMRSAGVICVVMNLRDALYARCRSCVGIDVRSKYSTRSRLSRYGMLPGVEEVILASVADGTAPPVVAGRAATGVGAGGNASAEAGPAFAEGVVDRRWNSAKLTFCGSPSSVTVKSLAVSPSTRR